MVRGPPLSICCLRQVQTSQHTEGAEPSWNRAATALHQVESSQGLTLLLEVFQEIRLPVLLQEPLDSMKSGCSVKSLSSCRAPVSVNIRWPWAVSFFRELPRRTGTGFGFFQSPHRSWDERPREPQLIKTAEDEQGTSVPLARIAGMSSCTRGQLADQLCKGACIPVVEPLAAEVEGG